MPPTKHSKDKDSKLLSRLALIVGLAVVLVGGFGFGRLVAGRKVVSAPQFGARAATATSAAPVVGAAPLSTSIPTAAAEIPPFRGSSAPVAVEEVPVQPGEPRLWVAELSAANNYTYDLGEIPGNEVTERVFTVTNVGQGTLVIEGVDATCGCSAAAIGKDTLLSGESTMVEFSYDPRTYGEQGKQVTKSFLIRSNDPLVPLAEVRITALVAES